MNYTSTNANAQHTQNTQHTQPLTFYEHVRKSYLYEHIQKITSVYFEIDKVTTDHLLVKA